MLNLASFMQTLLDWNTDDDEGGEHSPTKRALSISSDSDTEDHGTDRDVGKLKRDASIRTAAMNSVSVHSSSVIHGNAADFTIPKGALNSKVAQDIIAVYKKNGHLNLKSIQKILRFSYKSFKKLNTTSSLA